MTDIHNLNKLQIPDFFLLLLHCAIFLILQQWAFIRSCAFFRENKVPFIYYYSLITIFLDFLCSVVQCSLVCLVFLWIWISAGYVEIVPPMYCNCSSTYWTEFIFETSHIWDQLLPIKKVHSFWTNNVPQ